MPSKVSVLRTMLLVAMLSVSAVPYFPLGEAVPVEQATSRRTQAGKLAPYQPISIPSKLDGKLAPAFSQLTFPAGAQPPGAAAATNSALFPAGYLLSEGA